MVVSLCQCTHESHWKVTDKLAVVDVRHDRSRQSLQIVVVAQSSWYSVFGLQC